MIYCTLKRLSEIHRTKVLEHFIRLDHDSRSSRFCTATSNDNMSIYVQKIDFKNGIFGIFNDNLDIIGLGECVFFNQKNNHENNDNSLTAEVAFTVEKKYQGNGLGNKLMKRVVQYANSKNINELHMFCIRTNKAILHLAKKYNLVPQYDGTEISGIVKTPNVLPIISNMNEQFEDNIATFELVMSLNNKIIKNNFEQFEKNNLLINKIFQS